MLKLVFKTSLISFLLMIFIVQGSIVPGTKIQDQLQKMIKTPVGSKGLNRSPNYGRIPLYFIPNEGQVSEEALFYAKASRYTLWLTKEGMVFDSVMKVKKDSKRSHLTPFIKRKKPKDYTYKRDVSRLIFHNSEKNPEVIPLDHAEHHVNYFNGNDEANWQTNIQTSRAILYKELYRNIDLKIYGAEKQIEYDFVVKPGGEVADICFMYKGVKKTKIDKEGNLVIETEFGELAHAKPVSYQVIEGEKVGVEAKFKQIERNTYGFEVKEFDKNYELIIDPLVLVYSTYLGGSDWDYGSGIAVDSEGAVYVTGRTSSNDFPTKNPIQGYLAGSNDVFITKINSSGSAFVYSTYLGGSGYDRGLGIAVDSEGAVCVTGETNSYNFPTENPIQESKAGMAWSDDAFITKINPSGDALVYSTYLGGSDSDYGEGIAVDSYGAAYVVGVTWSNDFPTKNPIQPSNAAIKDAFIAKLSSTHTLTLSAGEGGTTRPKPGTHTYEAGTKAKIKAIPDEGYKFSHWSGDASGTDNPVRITMDSDKSIKANFIRQYTLTITSEPGGTTDPAPGAYTYDPGTEVAISAIPESEYRFGGWSGDISSTENPITISMNSDISIKANFIKQYTLTLASGPGGTTKPPPGGYVYDEGTEVTISCIPDTHCRFSHWSGDASGTSDPLAITMDSDKNVVANFIRIIYAPQNFTGQKVLNRSLSQAEYINFLTWQTNPNNANIVKYRIYHIEGDTQSLLVELNANTFDYWHRRVERDKQYTYALVAVNNEEREGNQAIITVQ